jgi:hypothetical protein
MLSCRGLSQERLHAEGEELLQRMRSAIPPGVTALIFTLPGAALPPAYVLDALLDHGVLPAINLDLVPAAELPPRYVGMTDRLDRATPFAPRPAH